MDEMVHEKPPTLPALRGQALFDNPVALLGWDDSLLIAKADELGREAGPIMAQVRRAAGLFAWAAWHRFEDKAYAEFVGKLADHLGVSDRSIRNWRDALTEGKDDLAIPAKAQARREEAEKRSRPKPEGKRAGQRQDVETSSTEREPIPVESKESNAITSPAVEPAGPADGGGQGGASPRPHGDGEAAQEGRSGGSEPADVLTEVARVEPERTELNTSDEPPTTRVLVLRLLDVLCDLPPADLWNETSDEEKGMVSDYINELREVKATAAPPKRSPGRVIRPEDRAKAKLASVPVDPATCDHPRDKRKKLAYGNLCERCGRMVA